MFREKEGNALTGRSGNAQCAGDFFNGDLVVFEMRARGGKILNAELHRRESQDGIGVILAV